MGAFLSPGLCHAFAKRLRRPLATFFLPRTNLWDKKCPKLENFGMIEGDCAQSLAIGRGSSMSVPSALTIEKANELFATSQFPAAADAFRQIVKQHPRTASRGEALR
jgi:hypothetical protein